MKNKDIESAVLDVAEQFGYSGDDAEDTKYRMDLPEQYRNKNKDTKSEIPHMRYRCQNCIYCIHHMFL